MYRILVTQRFRVVYLTIIPRVICIFLVFSELEKKRISNPISVSFRFVCSIIAVFKIGIVIFVNIPCYKNMTPACGGPGLTICKHGQNHVKTVNSEAFHFYVVSALQFIVFVFYFWLIRAVSSSYVHQQHFRPRSLAFICH